MKDPPAAVRRTEHTDIRFRVAVEVAVDSKHAHTGSDLDNASERVADDVHIAVSIDPERADVAEGAETTELGGVLDRVRGGRVTGGGIERQRDRPDPPA